MIFFYKKYFPTKININESTLKPLEVPKKWATSNFCSFVSSMAGKLV